MSRLSIVIPCLGGAEEFDGTLVSVLQNRPADCEVVVVHTAPYDDPYELAGEVRFIKTDAHSLVDLLNIAIHHAAGEVLHIIGCGLEACEDWTAAAVVHFDDPEVVAVSPVVLSPDRQAVVAAGVRWSPGGSRHVVRDQRVLLRGSGRLRSRILGPTLAAAFYRRDVLLALGGFDAALGDELADMAIALDAQALGRLHVCEPASQLIQSQNPKFVVPGGFSRGRAAERLFWRAATRSETLSLALHPLSVLAEGVRCGFSFSQFASLAGRAAAWIEIGAVQRHERHLEEAATRLSDNEARRPIPLKQAPRDTAAPARRRAA